MIEAAVKEFAPAGSRNLANVLKARRDNIINKMAQMPDADSLGSWDYPSDNRKSKPVAGAKLVTKERKEWLDKGTNRSISRSGLVKARLRSRSSTVVQSACREKVDVLGLKWDPNSGRLKTGPIQRLDRTDMASTEYTNLRPIYLSKNTEFAEGYQPDVSNPDIEVFQPIEVYTNVKKPFDYDNEEHMAELLEAVRTNMPESLKEQMADYWPTLSIWTVIFPRKTRVS